ncbi:MAG TPA: amidohydrolase family protein [Caulobacteraceae bacterium]|nr:amidohydrolase family protein [Caulobacteraceae bacterium]
MRLIHTVLASLAAVLAVAALAPLANAADLAVIHAKLYASPAAMAVEDATVLAHDGRIVAVGHALPVPKGATIVDARGGAVTYGLWNSHIHLMTPDLIPAKDKTAAQLSASLEGMLTRWGFTTVFDIASPFENTKVIRRRIASGEVTGPMILTVGDAFFPKNGTPIYVKAFFKQYGFPSWEIDSLPAAEARARRELADGTDGLKLFIGAIVGGKIGVLQMPTNQAKALADIAHAHHKPVFAHPSNTEGVENAIRSGVDILAHTTPEDSPWSPELIARMRAHHMALIPTMTLFDVENRRAGASQAEVERVMTVAVGQLKAYSDTGGQILFGTDVGYIDTFDTTDEYRQMARALDWRQILASLTTDPAERFGYAAHKGRVAKGMDADLVVLDGDPAKDVSAFARVRDTIRDGKVIYAAK